MTTTPADPARRAPEDETKPGVFRLHNGRWLDVMRLKDGAVVNAYDWRPRPFERPLIELTLNDAEITELISWMRPPLSPDEVVVRRESLAVLLIAAQHACDLIPYYSPLRLALVNFRAANESLGDLALTAPPDEPR